MKKTTEITLLLFTLMLLLSGCAQSWYDRRDVNRQHEYNYKFPNELAKDCARQFPVKDSVGQLKHAAENKDYSKQIDSLQAVIDDFFAPTDYTGPSQSARMGFSDSTKISGALVTLQRKITALKAAYKPCKPDTLLIYLENTAKVVALKSDLDFANNKIAEQAGQNKQLEADKAKDVKWIWILAGIIGGSVLIFIIRIVIKIYTGGAGSAAGAVIKKL